MSRVVWWVPLGSRTVLWDHAQNHHTVLFMAGLAAAFLAFMDFAIFLAMVWFF